MVRIRIKNLLRVSGQGEYDLVAVFTLPLLAVCHRPLLWYACPSSARAYESNCDCDSVVSKTLEWPCAQAHTQTHSHCPHSGPLITSTHLTLTHPLILPFCLSVTYHRVCH